ncbi:hypothetical protein F5B19DRAFT_277153 [Rostrohypoxylon terebratum]|nr:hypothetical protein F5B19DRAFT_277153 [Rostrohypoxylon terebratum]
MTVTYNIRHISVTELLLANIQIRHYGRIVLALKCGMYTYIYTMLIDLSSGYALLSIARLHIFTSIAGLDWAVEARRLRCRSSTAHRFHIYRYPMETTNRVYHELPYDGVSPRTKYPPRVLRLVLTSLTARIEPDYVKLPPTTA